MSRMGEWAYRDEDDAHTRWEMELQERAYMEWASYIAADPGYFEWIESINARTQEECT